MKPFYFTIDESVRMMLLLMRMHIWMVIRCSLTQPYKGFTYASDGINERSGDQVQEIIEKITRYRTNPALWRG